MKLIVKTHSKKQEKAVKDFLDKNDVEFTVVNEEQAVYITTPKKQLTKKEKQVLDNLSESVEFVKKYRQGKIRAKQEDIVILNAMANGRKTPLLKPAEKAAFLRKLKSAK